MSLLQSYIHHQFNSAVWRLEIDELSDTIFVEVRNDSDKQVSFSSIDLTTGKLNFDNLTTPERWLTGIEVAYDGVLLLHNYQSASGPTHKGLIAVNAFTGETLWSNYIYAFDHLTTSGPVFYDTNFHPKKLFLADIKTGATTRIYQPFIYPELQNSITAPQAINPENLPSNFFPVLPYGNSAHYLEYNNFRIVSLHALQSGLLKQYIFVMDGMDKVYEDLLNTDIQKLQPEAFILHKNRLIYIKNKTVLVSLSL